MDIGVGCGYYNNGGIYIRKVRWDSTCLGCSTIKYTRTSQVVVSDQTSLRHIGYICQNLDVATHPEDHGKWEPNIEEHHNRCSGICYCWVSPPPFFPTLEPELISCQYRNVSYTLVELFKCK